MDLSSLIGWALVAGGAADFLVGFFVVGRRVPPEKRPVVIAALALGGVGMIALGGAFLAGLVPLG